MKQILQDMKTGAVTVADVPAPVAQRGRVLVRTAASLISAGTERMKVELGRKSLLGKARARPDLVRQVVRKAQTEGLMNTYNAVRAKLDAAAPLGYSAAGVVVSLGAEVTNLRVGARVACAGHPYAAHAEVLSVPQNLCVPLPEGVGFEAGAFGTLGAIALQGVRLAEPTLGEAVVVVGLGLLGQLTVQLLRANGCRVFGIDLDERRIALARAHGATDGCRPDEDAVRRVREWTRGRGADAVLVTAATRSNQPIELAGEISRLKGRVVAVGLVGMDVPREVFYERELTLRVSMSYGPGRYDAEYEERGHDYPFAYVRWTEARNIEAFLDLVAAGSVRVEPLVTHRFPVAEGERAYELIGGTSGEPHLGVLLTYPHEREPATGRAQGEHARLAATQEQRADATATQVQPTAATDAVRVGLIGAGSYARKFLLPQLRAAGAEFQVLATATGVSARDTATQYGFQNCAAAAEEVINDERVNLVVIATRHDTHAPLAAAALRAGRHVFVEKPLALSDEELEDVLAAAAETGAQLFVGFNRRFAPLAVRAREFFADVRAPLSVVYRVNAGRVARDHWTQDPRAGGGRIVGEVCHFLDLMQFFTGAPPVRVYAEAVAARSREVVDEDSVVVTVRFADGSNGTVAYVAEGDAALPKERVELFGGGRAFVLEDFRRAQLYRGGREEQIKLRAQDKGQAAEVRALCAMVRAGTPAPITLAELSAATRATFRILDALRTGAPQQV
ncbi:MAG TPA: bi-domain-containing oxidoreductase [Pyrinomonadaceae bacterium]|jgi:polar amino acid transport system substrate-binding protein